MGQEFRNKQVNAYLKSQNIHHFYALNTETKANYAERLIKTLKHKLFRYMLKNRTQNYIDVLQDVVYIVTTIQYIEVWVNHLHLLTRITKVRAD